VTDAVRETRNIIRAAANISGEQANLPKERFAFEYRGSMQGFESCPYAALNCDVAQLSNTDGRGLSICFAGKSASFSTPTFFDPNVRWQGYDAIASPSLYEGQTLTARFFYEGGILAQVTPYICFVSRQDAVAITSGGATLLGHGGTEVCWTVPRLGGQPIIRVGFTVQCEGKAPHQVTLRSLDWTGAPQLFQLTGALQKNITDPTPYIYRQFVSSAKNFGLSLTHTLCVSHPDENGVVTIGTRDFADYSIAAQLTPQPNQCCGLVIRSRGHRQYYAALLSGYNTLSLILRDASGDTVLAQCVFPYTEFEQLSMTLSARGNNLKVSVRETVLTAVDASECYPSGGAGFRVDSGTMMVDDIRIQSMKQDRI
jgi:hypothetical protein